LKEVLEFGAGQHRINNAIKSLFVIFFQLGYELHFFTANPKVNLEKCVAFLQQLM
jgi:hypothetical protein